MGGASGSGPVARLRVRDYIEQARRARGTLTLSGVRARLDGEAEGRMRGVPEGDLHMWLNELGCVEVNGVYFPMVGRDG
jgi:hypothetical protein